MGMSLSPIRPRTSATDGDWMDIPSAATYAGVPLAVFTTALRDGELPTGVAYGAESAVLVLSHAVEAWAVERESLIAVAI
jgi:hypothetical protein